ncbi:DNA cytosine methyltransferase [Streptomyces violascens]|uniref:Cytosine-specific methyltransferase n=1 Tax=Streptomyces violascens TaxID=67381 RepID=A0ABQ3QNP0_9ACTN|nr:DNA (cytosine-5-)-methyltransferase [Streptomyces violascens]GGU25822.1 cytosine-specific methyltransferase [Streptomyces violascens]GHI38880.1 cytosine-specific methyltransferase [Streptomyces violascens]
MARTNELKYSSVEICAGAGGQAVGLHQAGFRHVALIEIDKDACETLRTNTRADAEWSGCRVIQADLRDFDSKGLGLRPGELDLLAGGVPCPPFSSAGKQLGRDDERDLFPTMLDLVDELEPKAVMIENVRGLVDPKFADYRAEIVKRLESLGYEQCYWEVLEAKRYGVPQLRPRAILVAMKPEYAKHFEHSKPEPVPELSVGEALHDTMRDRFDAVADDPRAEKAFKAWYGKALDGVAPTLVGGSKKHGGADLGPTRAKRAWADLGVCGLGVANSPEELKDKERDLFAAAGPKLTVQQAGIIQGFPDGWAFTGKKTAAYRQVGNAFPPPVAKAVGEQIYAAFEAAARSGEK